VGCSMEPILFSRKQAASLLSISLRGLDYLLSQGKLRARRVGKRVLIPRQEIERFARSDHPEPIVPEVHRDAQG
jgi:excisionase family DNA binding protein